MKPRIPRTHIPKLYAICPQCRESMARIIQSKPYADGFHRKHRCNNCGLKFHTLTPYDGGEAKVQGPPFPDRELSPYEMEQRAQWWEQSIKMNAPVTMQVTFLEQINAAHRALDKTPRQQAIVAAVAMIEKHINAKYPTGGNDEDTDGHGDGG